MGILSKFFVKREQPKSSDNFNVILKTEKSLSKDQKSTIIAIVKNGTLSGAAPSDIAINIMMSTGIYTPVILNKIRDGVEVIL